MYGDKNPDPFLYERYSKLHDSPMQQKMRRIRPMPVGVVFIQHPGMSLDDCRRHFRMMKEHGFTCLKQVFSVPGVDVKTLMHAALDEGIIPWWYAEAGWEDPTPELLKEIGLDPGMRIEELRENEVWVKRQLEIMHKRVDGDAPKMPVAIPPQTPARP